MKVIRAKVLGFCSGVRRAVEMAHAASSAAVSQAGVYTLGPLIHNKRVLESLQKRGILCLDEDQISSLTFNSTVIIRAHGVSPLLEKTIAERANIIDATCPHVKTSQRKAKDFAEMGYAVFLAGEENHAEIKGIRGYVGDATCLVAGNPEEAEKKAFKLFHSEPNVKTVLIGQTTIREDEFNLIAAGIRKIFPSLEIVNSVCGAAAERQDALKRLCENTDAVIIAGGSESANTRRLFSLARELGKPVWLVETASQIPPEIRAFQTVGLSAGASTPDDLIDEIENTLLNPNLPL